MDTNNADDLDEQIVATVKALRQEFGACTARLVATRMQLNRELVRSRVGALRDNDVLTWSDVPGSLRPVPKNRKKNQAAS